MLNSILKKIVVEKESTDKTKKQRFQENRTREICKVPRTSRKEGARTTKVHRQPVSKENAPLNGTNFKLSTGLKGGPKRVETAGHCCQIENHEKAVVKSRERDRLLQRP